MRRREFITLLGGAAAAWPLAARAQQAGKVYRIGFLANDPGIPSQPAGKAFIDGLRENGFIDGRNILIDWRFGEGIRERHVELAAALVRLHMDVIVTSSTLASLAAKQATKTIPIVLLNVVIQLALGSSPAWRLQATASPACHRTMRLRTPGSDCNSSGMQYRRRSASLYW